MTGLRGAHQLAAPVRITVRPITLALVALLVTAILAVAIVLAASAGDDQAGGVLRQLPARLSTGNHREPARLAGQR
jgi:hypothetical protein